MIVLAQSMVVLGMPIYGCGVPNPVYMKPPDGTEWCVGNTMEKESSEV